MQVRRGERYAIMGPNGSGKSTLLKTFAGRIPPLSGTVTYGHNVQVGYYDQTLGDLNPNGRVIDEVWDLDHTQTEEEVRSYLARFSFFDDDVFKKTRDLSGGEKGRLALAKIMYVGGNVMLLDEPTNHLDVYTREALEEALEGFTGALIVVSHDRYFIDRVAENIILVEDGHAEIYSGNYSGAGGAVQGRRGGAGNAESSRQRSRPLAAESRREAGREAGASRSHRTAQARRSASRRSTKRSPRSRRGSPRRKRSASATTCCSAPKRCSATASARRRSSSRTTI